MGWSACTVASARSEALQCAFVSLLCSLLKVSAGVEMKLLVSPLLSL